MSLIDGTLLPAKKEGFKPAAQPSGNRGDLAHRPADRILDDFSRAIHALDDFTGCRIEPRKLRMENFAGLRHHTLDPAELISRGDTDLVSLFKEVCRMEERFREEIKRYVRRPGAKWITPKEIPPLISVSGTLPAGRWCDLPITPTSKPMGPE